MQGAQTARGEIAEAVQRIEELAAARSRHAEGDRVDAEVAPPEVFLDGHAGTHLGQRARPCVALAAQCGEVDPLPAQLHARGGETRLLLHRGGLAAHVAQPGRRRGGEGGGVPAAREVQLGRRDTRGEVPDRTADHPQLNTEFRGGVAGGVEQEARVGRQHAAQARERRTHKRVSDS